MGLFLLVLLACFITPGPGAWSEALAGRTLPPGDGGDREGGSNPHDPGPPPPATLLQHGVVVGGTSSSPTVWPAEVAKNITYCIEDPFKTAQADASTLTDHYVSSRMRLIAAAADAAASTWSGLSGASFHRIPDALCCPYESQLNSEKISEFDVLKIWQRRAKCIKPWFRVIPFARSQRHSSQTVGLAPVKRLLTEWLRGAWGKPDWSAYTREETAKRDKGSPNGDDGGGGGEGETGVSQRVRQDPWQSADTVDETYVRENAVLLIEPSLPFRRMYNVMLHELGHVLGLRHEFDDSPHKCTEHHESAARRRRHRSGSDDDDDHTNGVDGGADEGVGSAPAASSRVRIPGVGGDRVFDEWSVMGYPSCGGKQKRMFELSPSDRIGLKRLYGRSLSGRSDLVLEANSIRSDKTGIAWSSLRSRMSRNNGDANAIERRVHESQQVASLTFSDTPSIDIASLEVSIGMPDNANMISGWDRQGVEASHQRTPNVDKRSTCLCILADLPLAKEERVSEADCSAFILQLHMAFQHADTDTMETELQAIARAVCVCQTCRFGFVPATLKLELEFGRSDIPDPPPQSRELLLMYRRFDSERAQFVGVQVAMSPTPFIFEHDQSGGGEGDGQPRFVTAPLTNFFSDDLNPGPKLPPNSGGGDTQNGSATVRVTFSTPEVQGLDIPMLLHVVTSRRRSMKGGVSGMLGQYDEGDEGDLVMDMQALKMSTEDVEERLKELEDLNKSLIRELKIDRNTMSSLPDAAVLSSFTRLRVLSATDNRLGGLFDVCGGVPRGLTVLRIASNGISGIECSTNPNSTSSSGGGGAALSLEELDISNNNLRHDQLVDLARMTGLKRLAMRNCGILQLPDTLRISERLTYLDVSDNYLRSFPEQFLRVTTGLTTLLASNNILTALPELDSRAPLSYVDLTRNELTSVDSLLRQFPLERLSVSSNQLRALTLHGRSLESLESLDASGNEIRSVSTTGGVARKLAILDASDNHLTNLDGLDGYLPALVAVRLSRNNLVSVDGLRSCSQLRRLDVGHNQLTHLPPMAMFRNLEVLNAAENALSSLPSDVSECPLEHVNVDRNMIASLSAFSNSLHLQSISAENNNLTSFVLGNRNSRINVIKLSHNRLSHIKLEIVPPQTLLLAHNSLEDHSVMFHFRDDGRRRALVSNLDLSYNKLRNFDSCSFPTTPFASSLNLEGNQLVSARPFECSVANGGRVNADYNQITVIASDDILSLQSMSLRFNGLREIEMSRRQYWDVETSPLVHLDLRNNNLTSLPAELSIALLGDGMALLSNSGLRGRLNADTPMSMLAESDSSPRAELRVHNLEGFPLQLLRRNFTRLQLVSDASLTSFPRTRDPPDAWAYLEELTIDNAKVQHIPEWVLQLPRLKILELVRVTIRQLGEVTAPLERLVVKHTFLSSLPESVGRLSTLRELELVSSPVDKLPTSVSRLRNLERLIVVDTQMKDLSVDLMSYPKLAILRLDIIPEQLATFSHPNLVNLMLRNPSHSEFDNMTLCLPSLSQLDMQLGLKHLHFSCPMMVDDARFSLFGLGLETFQHSGLGTSFLDLRHNKLTQAPRARGVCMWLSFNSIEHIPEQCDEAASDTSHSHLTPCPWCFAYGQSSTTFSVASNKLTSIPTICSPNSRAVTVLNLARNNFSAIPHQVVACHDLYHLIASHNNITSIPKWILGLTKLSSLDLSHNSIGDYSFKAISAGRFRRLSEIDLSFNNLTAIPSFLFGVRGLKSLKMIGNFVSEIPSDVLKLRKLQVMQLSHNYIRSVPQQMTRISTLRHLWLDHNYINSLPRLGNNLRQLRVSHNNITEYPSWFRPSIRFDSRLGNNPFDPPLSRYNDLHELFVSCSHRRECEADAVSLLDHTEPQIALQFLLSRPYVGVYTVGVSAPLNNTRTSSNVGGQCASQREGNRLNNCSEGKVLFSIEDNFSRTSLYRFPLDTETVTKLTPIRSDSLYFSEVGDAKKAKLTSFVTLAQVNEAHGFAMLLPEGPVRMVRRGVEVGGRRCDEYVIEHRWQHIPPVHVFAVVPAARGAVGDRARGSASDPSYARSMLPLPVRVEIGNVWMDVNGFVTSLEDELVPTPFNELFPRSKDSPGPYTRHLRSLHKRENDN